MGKVFITPFGPNEHRTARFSNGVAGGAHAEQVGPTLMLTTSAGEAHTGALAEGLYEISIVGDHAHIAVGEGETADADSRVWLAGRSGDVFVREGARISVLLSEAAGSAGGTGGTGGTGSTGPSGLAPVAGQFVAVGSSLAFAPIAGRDFNLTVQGGAGVVQVERKFADDASWYVAIPDGMRTGLAESFSWREAESGVQYRLTCTAFTSGPIKYRISQ